MYHRYAQYKQSRYIRYCAHPVYSTIECVYYSSNDDDGDDYDDDGDDDEKATTKTEKESLRKSKTTFYIFFCFRFTLDLFADFNCNFHSDSLFFSIVESFFKTQNCVSLIQTAKFGWQIPKVTLNESFRLMYGLSLI